MVRRVSVYRRQQVSPLCEVLSLELKPFEGIHYPGIAIAVERHEPLRNGATPISKEDEHGTGSQ